MQYYVDRWSEEKWPGVNMAATMRVVSDFIQAVGFPAFVAVVLLYQVNGMHKENARINRSIAHELARLREVITGSKRPN